MILLSTVKHCFILNVKLRPFLLPKVRQSWVKIIFLFLKIYDTLHNKSEWLISC